ncbi:hypothetical protein ACFX14_002061 [Malus domestica]
MKFTVSEKVAFAFFPRATHSPCQGASVSAVQLPNRVLTTTSTQPTTCCLSMRALELYPGLGCCLLMSGTDTITSRLNSSIRRLFPGQCPNEFTLSSVLKSCSLPESWITGLESIRMRSSLDSFTVINGGLEDDTCTRNVF